MHSTESTSYPAPEAEAKADTSPNTHEVPIPGNSNLEYAGNLGSGWGPVPEGPSYGYDGDSDLPVPANGMPDTVGGGYSTQVSGFVGGYAPVSAQARCGE